MRADLTVPPLPVVADLRRGAEECAREGVSGWGNTMTAAADAIAALTARLEAAERSLRVIEEACTYSPHREPGTWDQALASLIQQQMRTLVASQEKPAAPGTKDNA